MTELGDGPLATLGSYRIEHLLGRGGMGAVYAAYDATLHRRVAIKVMTGAADAAASRSGLLREARNAAALNHPNICTIYEVGEADGRAFIAMEYVDGRTLRDRLDEGTLTADDVVRLGSQIADALGYAHDHNVVHRDFKAANTIVTGGDRVKIVDFGLARRTDAALTADTTLASVVPTGTVAGTPYAMAPEQVRGEPADPRTDIWALGVLLYEMVSGSRPFDGATQPELFSAILRDAAAPLPANVPLQLRAVIDRCLEKSPQRRYQRASEVRAALEAIAAGTAKPWTTPRRRHLQRGFLVAAAVVAALVAGVGFNVAGVRESLVGGAAPLKLAVLPFRNLTGDPQQEYFSDGLTDEIITQLGRLAPERLRVIARTSSMQYKSANTPLQQIGREIGVNYILEGSVRREANRVRISATLISVEDLSQRWNDSFESEIASVLALQSSVSKGVAKSLALQLLPAELEKLSSPRPINPSAYEAYLRGISHLDKMSAADLDSALEYFQLALQKEPNFAAAYAGVASVWGTRQQLEFTPPRLAVAPMKAAAAKALELDDALAEAHLVMAGIRTYTDWNWAEAEREFRRAIELDANLADAHSEYALFLMCMKRPAEARSHIEQAIQLDPLSEKTRMFYGVFLGWSRRLDEAIAEYRNVLRTAPTSRLANANLIDALHQAGKYDESFEVLKAREQARPEVREARDRGYAAGGYFEAMRQMADTVAAGNVGIMNPHRVLRLYLKAGRKEEALEWLERTYQAHDPSMADIAIAPAFDPVRADPRFQAMVRRMNLPQ